MSSTAIAELAKQLLDLDEGELTSREKAVIERAVRRLAVSRNVNADFEDSSTVGERLADQVAQVGGSWGFLGAFGLVIAVWVVVNSFLLLQNAFDPYPYILLNLGLSLLAAVQAPVILMSQNRQAARDRMAAAHDYEVNLKAEIEIAALHEKLDQIRAQELSTLVNALSGARSGGGEPAPTG